MKLMKQFLSLYLCVLFLFLFYLEDTAAANKYEMPYEITAFRSGKTGFEIEGWGLMIEAQHFLDANTHAYRLLLYENGVRSHSYALKLRNVDQSELMRMVGKRQCGKNEWNQSANTCNYLFRNVGFQGVIPYQDLSMDRDYEVHLEIEAKQSGKRKEISLFYPISEKITHRDQEFVYQAVSDLHETALQVTYGDVFARKKPSAAKEYYKTGNLCSYTHGNALYFRQNAIFQHIYERKVVDHTTYYRVSGKESVCEGGFRRVEEGNGISPLWIASAFVDYRGKPLTIHTYIDNEAPRLYFDYEPVLYPNEVKQFDFRSIVHATDKEDGNLDDKVVLKDGNVDVQPGNYELTYYVEDRYGAFDQKVLHVTVREPENTPPHINAKDATIYQYEPFDYLKGVQASDKEDGDLRQQLRYTETVNTQKLGVYPVTYTVTDSKGASAVKTIQVHVIRNPKEGLRYLSRKYPWYEQKIPLNWKAYYLYLIDQLKNRQIYYENSFDHP